MTAETIFKKAELITLSLFVFVLPSLETPKIIFWALYMLTFLMRRYLVHGISFSKPDGITLSVVTLFLVSLTSTLVNWPLEKSFSGSFDTLSYSALFLCLYHGGYTDKQIKAVLTIMIAGVLVGLLFGLIEYSSGITSSLSFHSAGVTTQSSIFLGIAIVTAFGFLAEETDDAAAAESLLSMSLFIMGVALLYMGSRGAIFAVLICIALLLALNFRKRLVVLSATLVSAVLFTSFFLINAYPTNINKPEYRERFSVERFQKSDNERLENWNIAVTTISTGNNFFWGIGPRNYQTIDPQKIGIESAFYKRTGEMHHAHNLFLTQWVEQGIMGLLALLTFIFLVIRRLKKSVTYCKASQRQYVWASASGALVVPVVAGFFNTPFYQEHAMLAMILMGAMFSETNKTA